MKTMNWHVPICLFALICSASGCAASSAATAKQPARSALFRDEPVSVETGVASYYGGRWIGRLTASGERYRAADLTAAHRRLPFGTIVRVTNRSNGRSVLVRINNRGPYSRGRVIDLSIEAAREIGMVSAGLARVKVEVLAPAAPREEVLQFVQNQRQPPAGG